MSPTTNQSSQETPGRRLRNAWAAGPIAIPGVMNPLVGRMAEQMGFQAIYLSGAALSASLGFPDVGLLTLTEVVDAARAVTLACSLPLICDADTGFGEALNVERTVHLLEAAGVAGLHFEDQELPKRCGHLSGKELVPISDMVSKIRAAVASRLDPDFVIIARTDARGVEGLDGAIQRAQAYVAAGADVIFPEALETPEEFEIVAQKLAPTPLLANMTEFGRSPNLDVSTLGKLGYRLVIFPVSTLRVALFAVRSLLEEIRNHGHQRECLDSMLTRRELYELLDYQGYEARDRSFFG